MFVHWIIKEILPYGIRPSQGCFHEDYERCTLTPQVIQHVRTSEFPGHPRRKVVFRGPPIRSCCLEDRDLRAAWWTKVSKSLDATPEIQEARQSIEYILAQTVKKPRSSSPKTKNKGPTGATLAAFQLLGLSWPTNQDEIRIAWKHKARKAHPDAGGQHDSFVNLQNAYDKVCKYMKRKKSEPTKPPEKRVSHLPVPAKSG